MNSPSQGPPLSTTPEGLASPVALHPLVSVVVPVFNDPVRLELCLQALETQTYPKERYEVIVVDNGSARSVNPIVSRYGQARCCIEISPGSYAARNKGIASARGAIIAFTDADCIPSLDWIETGAAALSTNQRCGLVAGRVDVFYQRPGWPTSIELYFAVRDFQQRKYVEIDRYGATVNLFTRRAILDAVGPFVGSLKAYGDVEWGRRVAAHGYELTYCEQACVAHPARHTWGELYRKTARVAGGLRDLQRMDWDLPQDSARLTKIPAILASVWRDDELKTLGDRLRVLAVTGVVQGIKVYERLRLRLGGRSRR